MHQKSKFSNQFYEKSISLGQICDKKQIFMSNLCQKAKFQINSGTKNGFIKSTFINEKKKNCKQFYDKKQIIRSNLCQKADLREKADPLVKFTTKRSF